MTPLDMSKRRIFSIDQIQENPGIKLPPDSDYITIANDIVELLYPPPCPTQFRLVWSDRIEGNTPREDNVSYIHIYFKQLHGQWMVYIQKEAGWHSYVHSADEAQALLFFISRQSYAVDPPV